MEFHNQRAIFLQIADLLTDGILEKKWAEDERIPSVRELAASIEVNPNTVMRAYTFLQDKDIVTNKRGIGFFVSSNAVSLNQSNVPSQVDIELLFNAVINNPGNLTQIFNS